MYAASTTDPESPGLPPYTSRPGVSCLRPIMTPLLEWREAPVSGVIAPLPSGFDWDRELFSQSKFIKISDFYKNPLSVFEIYKNPL